MLRDMLLRRPRVARPDTLWAVRDISFRVRQGETFGIIGHNGAGKSTLMTLLGGVVQPTRGDVVTTGRMGLLLEVGTGFHPDLTGRENIILNASLHGMSRKQVMRSFDAIVAFSELETFLDTPIRNYSSGMCMRLAFSVAVQMKPDILLVDEVLGVGDRLFQEKCRTWMDEFRAAGRTLILVSHSLDTMRNICDRVVWIDHGALRMEGATDRVIDAYMAAT